MRKFENDLSKGNVPKQLITFALPFIISNLIQSLYSIADMIIVGQFAGAISMSGVNIGSQVTMLMTNLVFGIAAGGTVLIGQYLGAKERDGLKQTISTMLSLLFFLALAMTALMLFFRVPILNMIETPAPSYSEAQSYLTVTALGTVFIFGYNALSAIMRGMGDSRRPLIFVTIACFTNIVLDIIAVGLLNMGALGAGLATVISQALSMTLCILYLRKNAFVFDFNLSSFKMYKDKLKLLLRVGVPMSLQNTCVSISFLFLTAMVNILDPTAIASAAVGAVSKFNAFGVLPAFAMSSAIAAMSAQNIGANELDRAKKTMQVGMALSFSISFSVFLLAQFFPAQILGLFADDPKLVEVGVPYLRVFSWDYVFVPIMASFNGLFIGAGRATFTMIMGITSSLLVRIPACYLFGIVLQWGLPGIGFGAPAASFVAVVLSIVFFSMGKWKQGRIIDKVPHGAE